MTHTDPPLDALCKKVALLGEGAAVVYAPGKTTFDTGFRLQVPKDGKMLRSAWFPTPGELLHGIDEMRRS